VTTVPAIGYGYSPCAPCCNSTAKCGCPNGVSKCWSFTTTGNSEPAYNGTFCLVQSTTNPCVFTDGCTHHWTLTFNGGATTLASDNGAVYTLTETLNCTGLNSFGIAKSPAGGAWQQSLTINPANCNAYPCYPNCAPPPCASLCPNGISQCWLLTMSAAPLAAFNGTFCLVQQNGSTCFFSDQCSGLYSMSSSGGSMTVQTTDGTVKWTLSGNSPFQCNGSNTFYLSTAPSGTTWPPSVTVTPTTGATSPCFPNCPPQPTCSNCYNTGKTIATCWTFTVGGVGGAASGCFGFNTTYYLIQTGPCAFSNCTSSTNSVIPAVTMAARGDLWVLAIGDAIYTAPAAGFDCQACNTFSLKTVASSGSGLNSCTGWPPTLNVCPSSNCPTNQYCYCNCPDALPGQYEVSVSGITDGWCLTNKGLDCTWANGTFALPYGPVAPIRGNQVSNFINFYLTCTTDSSTLLTQRRWYVVFGSVVLSSTGGPPLGAGYLYYQYLETVAPYAASNPCGGEKTLTWFNGGAYCSLSPLELTCPGAPGTVTLTPIS
jgi:hypothetical protein